MCEKYLKKTKSSIVTKGHGVFGYYDYRVKHNAVFLGGRKQFNCIKMQLLIKK